MPVLLQAVRDPARPAGGCLVIDQEEGAWIGQLEADLVRDEGEILHAYSDNKADAETLERLRGYLTIGVGILIDPRRGGGITREESRYLLQNRLATVFRQLDHSLPWWSKLDPVRRRVLANMAFNLGIAGLLGFHKTLTLIEEGQFNLASKAMLESKWAQQVGARADRLSFMLATGKEPA